MKLSLTILFTVLFATFSYAAKVDTADVYNQEMNRTLHRKLIDLQIPHNYIERPGEHNTAYWSNASAYQLLFIHNYFNPS